MLMRTLKIYTCTGGCLTLRSVPFPGIVVSLPPLLKQMSGSVFYLLIQIDNMPSSSLIALIQKGCRIGCRATKVDLESSSQNMLAAYSNVVVVDKYIKEELECGHLVEVQSPLANDTCLQARGYPKEAPTWKVATNCRSDFSYGSKHQRLY